MKINWENKSRVWRFESYKFINNLWITKFRFFALKFTTPWQLRIFFFLFFFILSQKREIFAIQHEILRFLLLLFLPSLLLTLNSHHLCVQYYIHGQRRRRRWRWSIFPYRPRGIFDDEGRIEEKKKRREKNFFCKAKWTFWDGLCVCWACVWVFCTYTHTKI